MKTEDKKSVGSMSIREFSRKGGESTKKRYGKEHFSKIGQKGAKSRWGKVS